MDKDVQFSKMIEAVSMFSEIKILAKIMKQDMPITNTPIIPHEFARIYGIERDGLLSIVLETYHQLRLKEIDEK